MSDSLSAREKGELLQKATKVIQKSATQPAGASKPNVNPNAPFVTTGPVGRDSQPFRYLKAFGYLLGHVDKENAKTEAECISRFRKAMDAAGYSAMLGATQHTVLVPFAFDHLPDAVSQTPEAAFCKAVMGGSFAVDRDEVRHVLKATGAQSYLDDTLGGALVGPPQMGEILPLMRNRSALDRAGAQTMPLPPNGKIVLPKEVSQAAAFWVPENNQSAVQTTVQFGQVSAQAKKLMALVAMPNDLAQFAGAAAEAIIRNNVGTSLALAYDYAGLYGAGSNGQPKGLINYTGTGELIDYAASTPTPGGVATNGNVLKAEDGDLMVGLVEDRNFDADEDGFGWVMRSRMYRRAATIGGDAVSANDEAGPFKVNLIRMMDEKSGSKWAGYPVTKSGQVRADQVKGSSGSTLTEIFGGVWNRCKLCSLGVLAFETFPGGLAEIQADQTILRAKLFGDVIYTYPGAYVWYKQLKFTK